MRLDPSDRVFGRGRLKMVTGPHVEVFREAAKPGESRRYTKRFLTTADGDYAEWTEREWKILARLIGHGTRCIPDVVHYDHGFGGTKLVVTHDAGATVDQWATLVPVERDGRSHAHVFEDCAHWWALAHHCLVALDEIHSLHLVHLDIKGDNICIPVGPASFDPAQADEQLFPVFRKLALIDFAFSLVSGESLATALPIGWQKDYDYQSPRLLHALEAGRRGDLGPTECLDWRCDMYGLAAMLARYLPGELGMHGPDPACGWTDERYDAARTLIARIRDAHDREPTMQRPHAELIASTSAHVRTIELAQSLERGWTLARLPRSAALPALPPTPVTQLAPTIRLVIPPRDEISGETPLRPLAAALPTPARTTPRSGVVAGIAVAAVIVVTALIGFAVADPPAFARHAQRIVDSARATLSALRELAGRDEHAQEVAQAPFAAGDPAPPSSSAQSTGVDSAPSASHPPHADPPTPEPVRSDAAATLAEIAKPSNVEIPSTPESLAARIEGYRSLPIPRASRAPNVPPTVVAPAAKSSTARRGSAVAVARKPQAIAKSTLPASTARAVMSAAPKRYAAAASTRPLRVASSAAVAPSVALAPGIASTQALTTTVTPTRPAVTEPVGDTVIAPSVPTPATSAPASPAPQVPALAVPASPAPQTPSVAPAREATPAQRTLPWPRQHAAPIVDAPRVLIAPAHPPTTVAEREASPVDAVPPGPPAAPVAPVASDTARRDRVPQGARREDPLAQARWAMSNLVPQTAAFVRAHVDNVLSLAATAHHAMQERRVVDAAQSAPTIAGTTRRERSPEDARRLHLEARHAYRLRNHVPEALELELKAFGADPFDAQISASLASLHLEVSPAQPERARQLAMHAISVRRMHSADDWMTLAVASALVGRTHDARNALYASLALSRNADRTCRLALAALDTHGHRLQEPVDGLLQRVQSQGRGGDACDESPGRLARLRMP